MDQYIQRWDRNRSIGIIFARDDNLLKDINKAGINQKRHKRMAQKRLITANRK
jgi:hypothetical protein